MGIIIGKFRKKKTTLELLENLEKEIKAIEEFKRNTEKTHRKVALTFIILSFGIYLIVTLILYYYWLPPTLPEKIKYTALLLCVPFLLLGFKKALTWYFNRKVSKNQTKLQLLKVEKKKILDKVMDTETYKVAKDILEKFAPEQIRKTGFVVPSSSELTPLKRDVSSNSGLRLRNVPAANQNRSFYSSALSMSTINNSPAVPPAQTALARTSNLQTATNMGLTSITPVPLPRSILPRNRTVFDKMVEYLIGDGPSNRFALICKNCDGHNGMALKEEFEYLSFRCCYCYTLNPARKKRPLAPKLEFENQSTIPALKNNSDTSDSEKVSDSDTESESEPNSKMTTLSKFEDSKLPDNETINYGGLPDSQDMPLDVDSEDTMNQDDVESEEVGSSKSSISEEIREKSDNEQEKEF